MRGEGRGRIRTDDGLSPTDLQSVSGQSQVTETTELTEDGRERLALCLARAAQADPSLLCVVESWPVLPGPIQSAILAIVEGVRR